MSAPYTDFLVKLRGELPFTEAYFDSGMSPIKHIEQGLGFFPYSNGLLEDNSAVDQFPVNGIMVLGQDFGTEKYVNELNGCPESPALATWRNLRLILTKKAHLDLKDCFFTNAIMGARVKDEPMVGKSPPYKGKYVGGNRFLEKCHDFLRFQVEVQKPKLIICLGKWTLELLNRYAPDTNFNNFSVYNSYAELGANTNYNIKIGCHNTKLVLIVHPSTPKRPPTRSLDEDAQIIRNALKEISYYL